MEIIGFLNVDKPAGMTSHDVVQRIRRLMGIKKVGHTGTLDPLATGVLALAVGKGTRLIQFLDESEKVYQATIRLGVETDTNDREGDEVSRADASNITREGIESSVKKFIGEIEQVPPMFSAIKQNGQKLYKLARAGKSVEREPRKVSIKQIRIVDFQNPILNFTVTCSKGTYIRSLARDLGRELGCGAHLDQLRRTRSGPFNIDDARSLGEIADLYLKDQLPVIGHDVALSHIHAIRVNEEGAEKISLGITISEEHVCDGLSDLTDEGGIVRICDSEWKLLAIGEVQNKSADESGAPAREFRPKVVLC